MFERVSVSRLVSLASFAICFALPAFGQNGLIVQQPTHHDVSPPLTEMIAQVRGHQTPVADHPVKPIPLPPGMTPQAVDPLEGYRFSTPFTPTVGLGFDGVGQGDYGFSDSSAPPDTEGAAGTTQYVQWVNTSFAVFNKTNGALIAGPTAGNTMWSGFGGGCQTNNDGDPIVLFDHLANRWIFTQFSVSTTPYLQCIAVSTTADATGTYNRYSYQFADFNDYPKMGIWPDAYYMSFNMFAGGTTFAGSDACAFDRNAMINGTTAQMVCFQQSSSVGGLLPADLDGATLPPTGSNEYYMNYGTNSLNLYKFHVDFSNTSNSTFTGPTVISVASFSALCGGGTCVPQPSTTNKVDSLADRLMYRLAYRNFGSHESLVVNHSVSTSQGGGVRWYEIQNPAGTPTVFQQGTFAPDASYRWMGSIAMDKASDIAVGYSVSSSSVFPSVAFTGRVSTDPSGMMETENTAISGSGSQNGTLTRWGDYSTMSLDPSDDCTFWYTDEFLKTTGTFNWSTRVASFQFPNCSGGGGLTASLNPTSLTFGNQGVGTSSAPQNITLTNNGPGTLTITTITASGDFSQTNTCGSSLAANANCTISVTFTPTTTGTRTGSVTVTDNATNSPQTASLTGTGTSGGGGGAQTATYDSTLKAPKCGTAGSSCDSGPTLLQGRDTMSGGAEPNQPNTINSSCADGTSGTFHSDESNDRLMVATTDGSTMAPGKTITVTATVWAYSSFTSDALDLYYASNANSPTWTAIQTNIVPSGAGVRTITATYTLPSGGSLQAVRANFRYQGSASSCTSGSYNDHDDLVFAVGAGSPTFTIGAAPSSVSVTQGSTATSTITITSQNSFSSATTLSASGLPSGVTASFVPNPITPPSGSSATSILTFTASSSATTGTSTVTVTGTSGTLVQSTTISLTVNASGGGGAQTATYSSTLKAPQCAVVGISCDSGATLLAGRDTMSGGAEPNQPNTINNSCADGTSGTFHSDESNDRLMIASTDGTNLTHAKTAKVTATVWAWSTGSSDSLDLYYAANASSPTWVFITTLKPSAGGVQSLSATFTLPTGSLQAVRANFRYQGSASSCTSGSYNDHDDLIFAVQ